MHRVNSTRRNRDAARKLFRELNDRTGAALQEHAQAAVAGAQDDIKRAVPILLKRLRADAAFQADMDAMERLMKELWPSG